MPITIPDRTKIRVTSDFLTPMNGQSLPALLATVAITNPGPIAVDPNNGPSSAGQAQAIQAAGAAGRNGYIGFNPDPNIPANGAVSPIRNAIVEGFAGVTIGSAVYIDATGADNSSTSSGLTHTQPSGTYAGVVDTELDAGTVSATTTIEIEVPEGATLLTGLDLTTNTTVAADDTNYWTATLTNLGTNGSGTTVLLLATDVNTSKATGGNGGFTAGVPTACTLSGNSMVVAAGQVLKLVLTKAASASNLVDLTIAAKFSGSLNGGVPRIGVGWRTDSIFFL